MTNVVDALRYMFDMTEREALITIKECVYNENIGFLERCVSYYEDRSIRIGA